MRTQNTFAIEGGDGVELPNKLIVIFGLSGGAAKMLDLAARLSLRGSLHILDCGNRSDMYRVARTLRFLTNDPAAMLKNIHLSRAFTCYQVVAMLERLPADSTLPVLVIDLLSTFMDESVHAIESNLLFSCALQQLVRISNSSPVVVSAKPLLSISSPRTRLLQELKARAFQVWEEPGGITGTTPSEFQIPLFSDL